MRSFVHRYIGFALVICTLLIAGTPAVLAQGVTTAAIHGVVNDQAGNPLPGANVIATHEPSGTTYGASTRNDGRFNLVNIRVGGPYTLRISYVGYQQEVIENITVALGENLDFTISLSDADIELGEVVVSAAIDRLFDSGRTGAQTNLSSGELEQLPSISRSFEDLTRLTPQSSGTSFAGRDQRFNNYTIDGIIYNNNFGLGTSQFAGGNPLSLDAIDEVQVNIAPFDVRYGGFSGGNVNAVTRSGGNRFSGSAYTYFRNERFIGDRIGDVNLNVPEAQTTIRGFRLGGPIMQNRLMFFFSYEEEDNLNPGLTKVASRPGLPPDGQNVSRVPVDRLEFVREQIQDIYGYDPGGFQGYNYGDQGTRINARLDWNINPSHKVMVRFNQYDAFRDVTVNGNSLRYHPSALRFQNTNRFGIEAMNFRNSHYSVDNKITSVVGEWNAVLGSRMANNFRVGYNTVEDPIRSIPGGQAFPFIEVLEYEGETPLYYMTLGNELFSVGNLLENKIFNITNNVSYFIGQHQLIFGVNYEFMTFDNAFNPVMNGFYRFDSYDDFVAAVIDRDPTVRPSLFLQGYSFRGPGDVPRDETKFGQFGIYGQTKFKPMDNLDLTLGLRVDIPHYPIDLPNNPNLDALNITFTNPRNGDTIIPDVSTLPPARPLWSPRVGFNWDFQGDRSIQLRGGSGLFTGRIPFVWISNQVNNNGVTRGGYGLTADQWGVNGNPEWDGFQSDVTYYRPDPATLDAVVSANLAITDENFKLPQVWRSNLAIDAHLPYGFIGTLEGIYNMDINSPLAVNVNTVEPTGFLNAPYPFPYWDGPFNDPTNQFSGVMLLTNINKGYYASITGQLRRDFEDWASVSLAYTRSVSKDHGLIGGSQAESLWPNVAVIDRNDPELGYSRFDQPNRIVGYASFNTRILSERNNTTFTIFYEGGERGRYSYTYSGNFGDGAARLMYIPTSFNDAHLIDRADGMTAAEQWEILDAFIRQDDYLSANRGKVAERNGARLPWMSRFDVRVTQDFALTRDAAHRIQVHFDVMNVGNMLNSEWGVGETQVQNNLMHFQGVDGDGNARFTINTVPGTSDFPTTTYRRILSIDETWRAQIGIRYIF
jgi:hypothetical protein